MQKKPPPRSFLTAPPEGTGAGKARAYIFGGNLGKRGKMTDVLSETAGKMKVFERNLDEIQPYEKNPRKNEAAVEPVAESLKEFGWQQPIVVDADGVIIAGHTRWKAAQRLGMKTAPVVIASDLSPEQVKAYRLADNKSGGGGGGWLFGTIHYWTESSLESKTLICRFLVLTWTPSRRG